MRKRKKQKQQNFPVLLLVAGGILLVLASVLLWQNQTSQPAQQAPGSSGHEEETYPEIARVSLEDAKAAFDSRTAVFVDVRGDPAYAAAHIAGSVSLPLGEIESHLDELDPNQWIITYCT
jgi:3-mercaptopyruvate sulfurtransferase SseA